MGPLEKLKAFGLKLSDIPKAAWNGIGDSLSTHFPEHAVDYNTAAEQFLNESSGERNPQYNRSKGFYGGMDYALRFNTPPEEAENVARLYQLKQALTKDPHQDLIDLQANLDGIRKAAELKKRGIKASKGPLDENRDILMQMAREYASTKGKGDK